MDSPTQRCDHAEPKSLEHLPYEVLHIILINLTPDSLVFLAQTCQHFRSVVPLERYHFVQCLLALELNPAYGGSIPLFDIRSSTMIEPSYQELSDWTTARYACVGCLRLLRYDRFECHMVQGLYFRKPKSSYFAAHALAEPGDARARAALRRKRGLQAGGIPQLSTEMERFWKQLYRDVLLGDRTLEKTVQKVLCGHKRHLRMCIECRHKKRQFSTERLVAVSILPQLCFRWRPHPHWPGYRWTELEHPPQTPQELIEYLDVAKPRSILTPRYRVRCPACHTWKNIQSFGVGDETYTNLNHYSFEVTQYCTLNHNFGGSLLPLECNSCLEAIGDCKTIQHRRTQMVKRMKEHELQDLQCALQLNGNRARACLSLLQSPSSPDEVAPSAVGELFPACREYVENMKAVTERMERLKEWE